MIRAAALTLFLLGLGGCATEPPETYWRDVTGAKRSQEMFDTDRAACNYQIGMAATPVEFGRGTSSLASALVSTPGPRAYDLCMRARGWQQVG
jgi:hypothetical protein